MGLKAAQSGQHELVEKMLDAALELSRTLPRGNAETGDKFYLLASAYSQHKRIRKALVLQKEALAIYDKTLAHNDPRLLKVLNALAEIYLDHGKPEKALTYCERAAAFDESALGRDHQKLLADTLIKMACISYSQHRFGESTKLYLRADTIRQKLHKTASQTHKLPPRTENSGGLVAIPPL